MLSSGTQQFSTLYEVAACCKPFAVTAPTLTVAQGLEVLVRVPLVALKATVSGCEGCKKPKVKRTSALSTTVVRRSTPERPKSCAVTPCRDKSCVFYGQKANHY